MSHRFLRNADQTGTQYPDHSMGPQRQHDRLRNIDSVVVTPEQLDADLNLLTLYVTDQTGLSRTYLPNAGYVFSQTWNITRTPSPTETIGKSGKFYYQMLPNS